MHMSANEIVAVLMASTPAASYGWRGVCPGSTTLPLARHYAARFLLWGFGAAGP